MNSMNNGYMNVIDLFYLLNSLSISILLPAWQLPVQIQELNWNLISIINSVLSAAQPCSLNVEVDHGSDWICSRGPGWIFKYTSMLKQKTLGKAITIIIPASWEF